MHSRNQWGEESYYMKRKLPAFDVLVDLARNDPDRLETLRQNLTKHIINSADTDEKRKRLAGLQFRVDLERQRARTPLAATIKLSEMMCLSLAELHRSMVTPLVADDPEGVEKSSAIVIPFPRAVTQD
ncbi:MAG: DUF3135 domain-containing protein [Gammaproteobacteria bacterium]|nr:DUF3135 domain-containing protein [Gammaproteobacteria bacterium]